MPEPTHSPTDALPPEHPVPSGKGPGSMHAKEDTPVPDHDPTPNTPRNPPYTPFQWLLVVLAVYSSAFFYGLDTTIVAVIQGPVVSRFGGVEALGWLGIGFPLGSIATIAAWSKAYGVFDTKWLYVASLVHFAAGSALCGGAGSMAALVGGRVWAGAGGAGMYLGQLNIWTQNTNLQQRSLYISGGGIVWGLGCILGPIIGGAFADSPATWRWAFYMNLVLFGLFTPVYFFVLHPSAPPSTPLSHRLKSFDYFGILLNAGTYTTFVIGLTIGGTIWPWPSSRTIGTLATSIALLVLFAAQQKLCLLTTAQDRVFPAQFLTRRTFVLLYVAQSCVQTALAIPIYYIPLLFQFTRGETAVASALRLLPLVVVNIVVVFANGALLPRFKYYVPWYLASGAFNTLGGALFFGTLSRETSTAAVYGYSVFLALGTGLAQQCAYSIASVKAARHVSEAIGFINNAQIGSVVVALTLTSLIFQNVGFHDVKAALAGSGFDDGEIRATLGGARSALFEGVPEGVRERVEEGIVRAIRWSFFPVLLAGAIGLLAAAGMRWERLFDGENDADANEEKKEDVEKDSGGEVEKEIKKETS